MHKNCFDIARLLMATLVLYSHQHALSGMVEPHFKGNFVFGMANMTLGGFAVVVFFAISGYLIANSFVRCESFSEYLAKRCRRLFPGLTICSFLCIFVLLPFYKGNHFINLIDGDSWHSFIKGVMLQAITYPGAFKDFIFASNTINGSLWTLSAEFFCYILLGTALTFNKSWKTPATVIIFCIGLMLYVQANKTSFIIYGVQAPRILAFTLIFAVGSLLAMTQRAWEKPKFKAALFLASTALVIITRKTPDAYIMGNMALATIIIIICTTLKDRLIAGKFDYSYGIYIYAWPIQQVVINELALSFHAELIITLTATVLLAHLSWFYVEKPFLSKRVKNPVLPSAMTAAQ